MNTQTIISAAADRRIVVTHRDSDPGVWIVRAARKRLFFWTEQLSSDWFNDEDQAMAFARELNGRRSEGGIA
jgi:hypothetical protein